MSQTIGAGNFVSWDGGCLFISHRGRNVVPVHAHYATQVAFGSAHGIGFRPGERDGWTPYDGVVIASRQPHSMDSTRVPYCAVLFVEPETREGRAINQKFGVEGISAFSTSLLAGRDEALFSAWLQRGSRDAVLAAARAVVQELAGGIGPVFSTDERILRATAYIRGNLGGALTLEAVAGEACLSPSRFRHLFVEETGMALRPYILWRRFLHVWDLLAAGATLSSAAHAAGFADAAHLTRTSRSMFGFPPSALEVARPLAPH